MKINDIRHSSSNSLHITVSISNWVIVAERNHSNTTFEAPYKVESIDVNFDIDSASLKLIPGRVSFNGKWGSKDGKKWLDRQSWFGWNNQKLQKFSYLPHAIQKEVFDTLCKYIETQISTNQNQLTALLSKGRFSASGYVEKPAIDNDDENDAPAFLPSVAETEASPFIGQDLTKWKIACEEAGIPWVSKRRGRKGKP